MRDDASWKDIIVAVLPLTLLVGLVFGAVLKWWLV